LQLKRTQTINKFIKTKKQKNKKTNMVYSTNITAMHISEHFNHQGGGGGATIIKMNENGGNIIDSWQHQPSKGYNKNISSNSWSNESTTSSSMSSDNSAAYSEVKSLFEKQKKTKQKQKSKKQMNYLFF
jgi:hypothetical protein